MIKLLLCSLFAFSYLEGSSQKLYFIYLQSEQQQPFFVKMDDKVHSSTSSGYLILSRLHDSTYNLTVGFPAQKYPEQKFTVTVGSKDHGYLLKNFGERGGDYLTFKRSQSRWQYHRVIRMGQFARRKKKCRPLQIFWPGRPTTLRCERKLLQS